MGDNGPVARPDASAKLASVAPRGGPSRTLIGVLVAVVAVVAVVAAVLAGQVLSRSSAPVPTATAGGTSPTNAVPKGATGFGGPIVLNPAAPANVPTLEVYEDPQCPICREFEAAFGPTLASLVSSGQAKVVVHTMTFLDVGLRNDSSVRAAGAAFCAADRGKFSEYMAAVYAGQPAQEGVGWTDAELSGFAARVGISGAELTTWQTCTNAKTYAAHVDAVEIAAEKAGVTGTPTVRLGGQKVTLTTPSDLLAAVRAATR